MKLKIGFETPIYMMLCGMVAIQMATPLHLYSICSLGTWLIILSTMLSFALAIMTRRIDERYLFCIIVLALTVFSALFISFAFEYKSLVSALSFLEIPILMTTYSNNQIKSVSKAIYFIFLTLSFYYLFISSTSLSHILYTEYGEQQVEWLTLGYNNPNETAMHLIVCFFVLFILFVDVKYIIAKALVAIDIVLIVRLIVLTTSRTAILMVAVFLFVTVIFRKRQVSDFVNLIFFSMPVLFLILIFTLITAGLDFSFLGEAVDTGRGRIYSNVLQKTNLLNFFFGDYSYGFKNLHNSIWSIYATIGIGGTITFIIFMYSRIRQIKKSMGNGITSKIALLGVLCIVAYTATEAAFFTAGGTYAVAFFSLYLLCISGEKVFVQEENLLEHGRGFFFTGKKG